MISMLWRSRVALPVLSACALVALVALRLAADIDRGQVWLESAAYLERQQGFGYAVIGRFGQQHFPAVIIARRDGSGELRFLDIRGLRRHYHGFSGYDLKVVTFQPLNPNRAPFMVVLRRSA